MKNIIKAIGLLGSLSIIFAIGYFIKLYIDFTQLIVSLGIAGLLILISFLYIYNWMKEKEEELKELNEAIDRVNMYVKDVEERYA